MITYSKMQTEAMGCLFAIDLPKISTGGVTYLDSYYDELRVREQSLSISLCYSAIVGSEVKTVDAVIRLKRDSIDRVDWEYNEDYGLYLVHIVSGGRITYTLYIQELELSDRLASLIMDWACGNIQKFT